ncbi:MAG: VRR-NUC domain-containing protein [Thermoanaerobaculia bacterium]|nr:VRR-NUC domain-containing protein [Thermoanaerobaculia bacterium]
MPVGERRSDTPRDEVLLADGYYVDNFQTVLDTVRERYDDLLRPEELDFAATFDELPDPCRRLYVRLISRKGPCFRVDLLSYEDVPDLVAATEELLQAGLLDGARDAEPEEVLATLRKAELVDVAAVLGADRAVATLRRGEIESGLADQPQALRVARDRFPIVRPVGVEVILVYRLLFFGNLGQDLSELVIRDLGIVRYEDYPLDRRLRLFDQRQEIDHALVLREYRHSVHDLLAGGLVDEALGIAEHLLSGDAWGLKGLHPNAKPQLDRLLNGLGRELERCGRSEEALAIYESAEAPPSRERRVRVLERLERLDEAHGLCTTLAEEPYDEAERDAARVIGRRLDRKLGLGPGAPRRKRRVMELEIAPDPGTAVESLVVEHLESQGRMALRTENWLWRSLFGLAFWDVVFEPLPGVFEHPFQTGPLDLYTADFRRRRETAVSQRLEELHGHDDLRSFLMPVYEEKQGIASSLVVWHPEVQETLLQAMDLVRGRDLALVADRLSRDLGRYRRGLPDLLVTAEKADGSGPRFELWEVKGPGDQLRAEQKAWIDYFEEVGIPAQVAKVSWKSGA